MKKSMVRMGAAFGAALVGFGLSAAQQGEIRGNAYVITVDGNQTVTMNADDVAALGDGKDMGSWKTMSGEQFMKWWEDSNGKTSQEIPGA